MKLEGQCVVVTGGASGIGAALARRFAAEGARGVVVADLQEKPLLAVADEINGLAVKCDVTREPEVLALIKAAESAYGPIDLFCSNAGIVAPASEQSPNEDWERTINVNVMAHVFAARALVPAMVERGGGYLLQTASAAGLLTQIGSATYSVSKHAALAFAEWLAITYGDRGIGVSALCPQGVDTDMLRGGLAVGHRGAQVTVASGRILSAAEVADAVVAGLAVEEFLILPHPEVAKYEQYRVQDRGRWLAAMRHLRSTAPGADASQSR